MARFVKEPVFRQKLNFRNHKVGHNQPFFIPHDIRIIKWFSAVKEKTYLIFLLTAKNINRQESLFKRAAGGHWFLK